MAKSAAEKPMPDEIAVRIRFMGDLRAVVGPELKLFLPQGTSIGVLLTALAERYGDPFAKWLFTGSGELHHSIVVFVNGQNIHDIGGLAAGLKQQGDQVEIVMLPMFEGG
jgi:hypothetical protein